MELTITTTQLAILGLSFTVFIWIVKRRAEQFVKLRELQLKTTRMRWSMHSRLNDITDLVNKSGLLNGGTANEWQGNITRLEEIFQAAKEMEKTLDSLYRFMTYIPIVIPESKIESMHLEVDRIAESVNVSRIELVPKFKEVAEKIAQLRHEYSQLNFEQQQFINEQLPEETRGLLTSKK